MQLSALTLYLGRKGITSPKAQLLGVSFAAFSPLYTPQGTAALDATGYGGFYSVVSIGNAGGWNPRFASLVGSDAPGIYHLLSRLYSEQSVPNLPNISARIAVAQQTDPWYSLPSGSDIVGQWAGSYVYPFAAANTWTVADAGQLALPPFPQGALTDPSALYLTPRTQLQDISGTPANSRTNWQALLPVDGSLIVAMVNNPSNGTAAVATSWLWCYADGLLVNRSGATDGPAWMYSVESGPTPNPARGAGGTGTQNSGAVNVNSGADPTLILDPTQAWANNSVGVNQLVGIPSDTAGAVYPLFGELQYSPLYLEPR